MSNTHVKVDLSRSNNRLRRGLTARWIKILEGADLWPVRHDAEYYRKVAAQAPDFLVRALLRLAADRVEGGAA